MEERMKFIVYYLEHEWPMASLCREFGISRKTGYKWVARYLEHREPGLADRSRAPHHHPHAVSASVQQAVMAARLAHPTWGPKKLRVLLQRQDDSVRWPAASTIGQILSRHGLVSPRRRRRTIQRYDSPLCHCQGANDVWSADYKGWFRTGDGTRCDPLTISDNDSRYLLSCQVVATNSWTAVQPVFEAVFRRYGMPVMIRTDNGVPFATTTVGGLSRLSIWWLKLGILPERIEPGKPAQNGRHERMHRTLKQETASPPKASLRAQQQAFDRFRDEYNQQRPHEAIDQQTPASRYHPSDREYPNILPQIIYPDDMLVRKVHSQGDLRWKSHQIYLSETLAGEWVGYRQVNDELWDIYFAHLRLAQLDTRSYRLKHLPQPPKQKRKTKPNMDNNNQKV
jgi:transposase InsO family protein